MVWDAERDFLQFAERGVAEDKVHRFEIQFIAREGHVDGSSQFKCNQPEIAEGQIREYVAKPAIMAHVHGHVLCPPYRPADYYVVKGERLQCGAMSHF